MVTKAEWLTGELTPLQQARAKQLQNREWLDLNIRELQQTYANRWIGVLDQGVAASAAAYSTVLEAVRERLEEAVIFRVPDGEIATPI